MAEHKKSKLKLTTRSRHAIMAMVELAQHGKEVPIPLSRIAASGKISLSYLEQLFSGLRRAGLVRSYRGPGGGYVLARPAKDILVSDILESAEDCVPAQRNTGGDNYESYGNPQTQALWTHIGEILHVCLRQVTLEDVTNDNLNEHALTNKLFETLR